MTAPITDEAWQQIVDGLEGVTPGPWKTHLVDDTTIVSRHNTVATTCDSSETERDDGYNIEYERMERDAAHIARLSPPTILAIDARMKALEAEVGRLRLALIGIEEYWNREPSDGAMLDALDVIIYRARAALEASK